MSDAIKKRINDLRMGLIATTVALSGVAEKSNAQSTTRDNDAFANAPIEQTIQSSKQELQNLNEKQLSQISNLTFEEGQLYYLSAYDHVISINEEKEKEANILAETEKNKELSLKSKKKVKHEKTKISDPNDLASSITLGQYNPKDKSITVKKFKLAKDNFFAAEKQDTLKQRLNEFNQKLAQSGVESHEGTHFENDKKTPDKYNHDVFQEIRKHIQDELSANNTEVLNSKKAYLKAYKKDPSVQLKDFMPDGLNTEFYQQAVKEGKIDIFSQDPEKLKEEYNFIKKGVAQSWENDFAETYFNQINKNTLSWIEKAPSHMMQTNEEKNNKEIDSFYKIKIGEGSKAETFDMTGQIYDINIPEDLKNNAQVYQEMYAPYDKGFFDAIKDIKSKEELEAVQTQAKSLLQQRNRSKQPNSQEVQKSPPSAINSLRGISSNQGKASVSTSNDKTFTATPEMFAQQKSGHSM